jgi:pyruvate,orthophosphate dikinase
VKVAVAEERGEVDEHDTTLLTHVRRLHETNPMLGLRGVRLGIQIPGLFRMQARAIAEAAADRTDVHGTPRAEIMVPLVASVRELEIVRSVLEKEIAEVQESRGVALDISIGTMIELPRAAFLADRIATAADFFSFGTNDLTQMGWGFSRDDVEASFFSRYFEHAIFDVSPFETLDQLGVGGMVEMGTTKGRQSKPDLKVGVCGEHGGDPRSVHFFDRIGLDYVSCSPFRVPVARLEAGRSVLEKRESGKG